MYLADKHKNLFLFCFVLLALVLVFSHYLSTIYFPDIISKNKLELLAGISYSEYLSGYFVAGRFMGVIRFALDKFLLLFGIDYLHDQPIRHFMTFIFLSLIIMLIYRLLSNALNREKDLILLAAVLIGFLNPAMAEILGYTDHYGHALALVFSYLSIFFFLKEKYMFSAIMVFLAVSDYQVYYVPLFLYGALIVYVHNRGGTLKSIVFKYGRLLLVSFSGAVLNVIFVRGICYIFNLSESRAVQIPLTFSAIMERIYWFCRAYARVLYKEFGVVPKGFLIACCFIIFIINVLIFVRAKHISQLWNYIFSSMIILVYPASFALTADIKFLAPRTMLPMYMAVGCFFYISYYNCTEEEGNSSKILYSNIVKLIIALNLFVTVINVDTIIADQSTVNKIEMNTIHQLQRTIENYENSSKVDVKNIYVYNNVEGTDGLYDNYINKKNSLMTKFLLSATWSDVESINFFENKDYERHNMSEDDFDKFFSGVKTYDLAVFNPDKQLYFKDDSLYWYTY